MCVCPKYFLLHYHNRLLTYQQGKLILLTENSIFYLFTFSEYTTRYGNWIDFRIFSFVVYQVRKRGILPNTLQSDNVNLGN